MAYTEHEFRRLLARRVRMRGDAGSETMAVAGDCFAIPAGFEGIREVPEPTRKLYAIRGPAV